MFLDDKPLFELYAVGKMQQEASRAVVDEQSRSTDAIKSLERKLGQSQEELKIQETEKRK